MAKVETLRSLPGGGEHPVSVEREGSGFRVRTGPSEDGDGDSAPQVEALVIPHTADVFTVVVGGKSFEVVLERHEGELEVQVGAERFRFGAGSVSAAGDRGPGAAGRQEIKAPMPGKVVKLFVNVGETVTAGQGLVLFEAMKMQNEIRSPGDGVVDEVFVEEGDTVDARAKLIIVGLN